MTLHLIDPRSDVLLRFTVSFYLYTCTFVMLNCLIVLFFLLRNSNIFYALIMNSKILLHFYCMKGVIVWSVILVVAQLNIRVIR